MTLDLLNKREKHLLWTRIARIARALRLSDQSASIYKIDYQAPGRDIGRW